MPNPSLTERLDSLAEPMQQARRVTALTGAGVSAESGIPTFRDALTGMWARYDPTELATPSAFRRQPELVWQWYAERRTRIAAAEPNPAHKALAAIEAALPQFHLITQNVDGLHQRAGSRNVIELHGNIFRNRCFAEDKPVSLLETDLPGIPTCPDCGSYLRPDVIWFNEPLPREAMEIAFESTRRSDIFLLIGTSAVVQPAASLPMLARSHGAILVEINPEPTPLSAHAEYILRGPAGELLPLLLDRLHQ